ncbi:lipoprotein [Methylocapsa sp. D3K7]|uniref:LPS translocon maturation chaperone LptM n=1 Tax=Methylocapsa sp. D3K7 TaxID=3041435 RepID=UPI00244EDC45|nr:lipoprotein [Methylocapsa sp. D3K7]WGJ13726.1 lipoprotein [Methylocapsa sp. D3K7]
MKSPPSKLAAALFLVTLALTLVSCGRRGALEPPPGSPALNVPLSGTPDEETTQNVGGLTGQNTANSSGAAAPPQAGTKPAVPHAPRPFPLDPLL